MPTYRMKYDILITSVPKMDKDKPAPGPAYLKSFLESKGKKVKVIDGNQIEDLNKLALIIDQYEWDWLGISVFSYLQHEAALELGSQFDNVVYGGPGITKTWTEKNYIKGEGEYALLEFLNGNMSYPGINENPPVQIENLDALPAPDYSDHLELHTYDSMVISGSRGCVRNCTFCDVANLWPKFKFVDGGQLAEMMHKVAQDTGVDAISFSDSLVNGSMKQFRELCKALSDNPKKIIWNGQFIARKENTFSPSDFNNLANSGCISLTIGIESGSEAVRHHMRKKFSNEDIDWFLTNLLSRNIHVKILLFVGYPTETVQDFQETKDLLSKYAKHAQNLSVSIDIMRVEHDTPIETDYSHLYEGDGQNWYNDISNYETRLERYLELFEHAKSIGYSFPYHAENKKQRFVEYLENNHTVITGVI